MSTPRHRSCYDGWDAEDAAEYDDVWRLDLSIHFFSSGSLAVAILPVYCADGRCTVQRPLPEPCSLEDLLTVIVTSSPVRSNPSTRMLQECLASLDLYGGLSVCQKRIMCDGFKVRDRSQLKLGVATDAEAREYQTFVARCARLCRADPSFRRTRVVRLARRQGSAFAIREGLAGHVMTPYVLIVPHDCILAQPVPLADVVAAMRASNNRIEYIKLVGQSTKSYAEAVRCQARCLAGERLPCFRLAAALLPPCCRLAAALLLPCCCLAAALLLSCCCLAAARECRQCRSHHRRRRRHRRRCHPCTP